RRGVCKVARAVRALGDEGGALDRGTQLGRFLGGDHYPLDRTGVVLRLPTTGGVRPEDRALDESRGLLGERHLQRLVELPRDGAAYARERLRGGGAGSAQR